jgi:hypothetical protein
MRVRCSFCGAEYDAAVTPAGLDLVWRCEHCGRSGLHAVEDDEPAAPAPSPPRERSEPER